MASIWSVLLLAFKERLCVAFFCLFLPFHFFFFPHFAFGFAKRLANTRAIKARAGKKHFLSQLQHSALSCAHRVLSVLAGEEWDS